MHLSSLPLIIVLLCIAFPFIHPFLISSSLSHYITIHTLPEILTFFSFYYLPYSPVFALYSNVNPSLPCRLCSCIVVFTFVKYIISPIVLFHSLKLYLNVSPFLVIYAFMLIWQPLYHAYIFIRLCTSLSLPLVFVSLSYFPFLFLFHNISLNLSNSPFPFLIPVLFLTKLLLTLSLSHSL